MDQPTFEQLPEMVSQILEKVKVLEKLLQEHTLKNESQEEMLNIKQAAIFSNLSIPTLYSKVCRKEIPVHKPGKRLYFQKSQLLNWIKCGERHTHTSYDLSAEELLLPIRNRRLRRSK